MSKKTPLQRADFWKEFHSKNWEKEPLVVNSTSSIGTVTISPEQLFEVVLRFTETLRAGKIENYQLRINVDGKERDIDRSILPYLPTRRDGTFEKYHERIMGQDKNVRYGIVIHELQSYDPHFFESVCHQIQPLANEIGVPTAWNLILFLGNYEASPGVGVHLDRGGVFQYPIVGTKKIRTWTGEYAEKHPDLYHALKYSKHLKDSVLLQSGPGGMLYWPSDRLHVGESTGGDFSVAVSLPYYLYDDFSANFIESELGKLLPTKAKVGHKSRSLLVNSTHLETNADRHAKTEERNYLQYCEKVTSGEMRQLFREKFLRHLSAYGFLQVPSVQKRRDLSKDSWVRVDSIFPILCQPHFQFRNAYIVACKGHCRVVKRAPYLPALLKQLNTGTAVSVGDLVGMFPESVLNILRCLYDMGGLDLMEDLLMTSKTAA